MKLTKKTLFTALVIFSTPLFSQASNVDFTLGAGYPFFAVPEISLATNDAKQRWFANYKVGLDDGFSAGFEHGLGDENKHAVGVFAGALGMRDDDRPCDTSNESVSIILSAIISCAISDAFDYETTNGVGLSYSYNFSGLNKSGVRLRLEAGYGEGSKTNEKRFDGGVYISYQF
jgi:hypothetical protein